MQMLNLGHRNVHRWLGGYARASLRRMTQPRHDGPRHLLVGICDHYEPLWGHASDTRGAERVTRWLTRYPEVVRDVRDADGRPPRHTFFFPGEQYRPEYLDIPRAAHARRIWRGGAAHLHHDSDDADKLTADLLRYLGAHAEHGHLARDESGRLVLRGSFTGTGAWRTRVATAAIVGWTPSSASCSIPAATPTLRSPRRRTRRSRTSSIRSIGRTGTRSERARMKPERVLGLVRR